MVGEQAAAVGTVGQLMQGVVQEHQSQPFQWHPGGVRGEAHNLVLG